MSIIDRVIGWWLDLPTWGKWTSVVFGVLSIDAVRMVWGERRPVGAFFEALIAMTIYWGIAIGVLFGGIWSGMKIAERRKSKLAGWAAGISFYIVVGSGAMLISHQIPGVGWRIDRLLSSEGDY
jgi:hypothetical protein